MLELIYTRMVLGDEIVDVLVNHVVGGLVLQPCLSALILEASAVNYVLFDCIYLLLVVLVRLPCPLYVGLHFSNLF